MTSKRLLNMSRPIEVLYLPKNLYPKKQFSGYAPNTTKLVQAEDTQITDAMGVEYGKVGTL